MISLTPVNTEIATPQAPHSSVSPGQIKAPFVQLGEGLDKLGEAAGSIAEKSAEVAGAGAVTRDNDGNLVVQKAPIIGPASGEYARAARFEFLAKFTQDAETKLTQLRLAFPNDPGAFKKAADGYSTEMLAKVNDPVLRSAAGKVIESNTGQNYRSALVEADTTNLKNTLVALQSHLSAINDQGASLARQGGTDTPEYAQIHADRSAIYGELTADKRFNYPQERADFELKNNRDADVVQAVVGNVVRQYQTKRNQAQAQAALQDAFWGAGSEKLNLTAQKRDAGVAEGLKALQRTTGEETAETTQNRKSVEEYVTNLQKTPAQYDDVMHGNLVQKSRDIGDYRSIMQLDAARILQPTWLAIGGLTDNQRVAVVTQMAHGLVPRAPVELNPGQQQVAAKIEAEARRQSVDATVAKSIAHMESRFDPNAASPTSSARGIFQVVKGTRETLGLPENATADQQIEAGVRSLKGNVEGLRGILGRDPTATEIYTAHFQGLQGAQALLTANPNADLRATLDQVKPGWGNTVIAANPVMQGMRTVGDYLSWIDAKTRQAVAGFGGDAQFTSPNGVSSGLRPGQSIASVSNPYVQSLFQNTIKEQSAALGKQAEHLSTLLVTDLENRKPPTADDLRTFALAANLSGHEDLVPKLEKALLEYDQGAGLLKSGTSPSVAALRSEIASVTASGAVNVVARQTLNGVDKMLQQGEEAMKKDPLKESAVRGWVDPIRPLATENPGAFAAELQDRARKIVTAQSRDNSLGPMSAITGEELPAVKTALTQGPVDQASGLIQALTTSLSADDFKATMATEPMKEALVGMARSNDPQRMTLGMSTLDTLWRASPADFKAKYGDAALTRLQAWQGMKDSFTATEIAERMNRADDPATAKARAEIGKEVEEKELKAYTPAEVAYQLGAGWPLTGHVTGNTPSVPYDGVKAQQLSVQFASVYKALRTYGVEPDQAKTLAVKRLQSEWGQSGLSGGQLMQFPPEKYYKPINGSQDWMRDDLRTWLNRRLGVEQDQVYEFGAMTPDPMARLAGLVSDPQTQAEIGNGKLPSYRIAVRNSAGLVELLPERIGWDRSAHEKKAEREFTIMDEHSKEAARLLNPTLPDEGLSLGRVRITPGPNY